MHSRIQFMEELSRLHHDILSMGTRVGENLAKALEALRTGDAALADEARAGDGAVDAMQVTIEDRAAVLIATQQPVAGDLRELVTVFKLTEHLERIGDYASHLAKAAKRLAKEPYPRSLEPLERMAELEISMIRDAVAAFLNRDAELARACAMKDDEVDQNHKVFLEEALDFVRENPDKAQQGMRLIRASAWLERLGDHVTNVCEAVVFMVEGRHVELNE